MSVGIVFAADAAGAARSIALAPDGIAAALAQSNVAAATPEKNKAEKNLVIASPHTRRHVVARFGTSSAHLTRRSSAAFKNSPGCSRTERTAAREARKAGRTNSRR